MLDRPEPPRNIHGSDFAGEALTLNWSAPFSAMRSAAGCGGAGYLSHEAALWDDATDRWLFLPRRASKEAFSRDADEERGANLMLWSGDVGDTIKAAIEGGKLNDWLVSMAAGVGLQWDQSHLHTLSVFLEAV